MYVQLSITFNPKEEINLTAKERNKKRFIKCEQTTTYQEPIKNHQEFTRNPPGINQNHARINEGQFWLILGGSLLGFGWFTFS